MLPLSPIDEPWVGVLISGAIRDTPDKVVNGRCKSEGLQGLVWLGTGI